MKNFSFLLAFLLCFGAAFTTGINNDLTKGFIQGNPGIASVNALTFGPEGILFIGDSKNAMIYAIETGDTEKLDSAEAVELASVDKKIANILGTTADKIHIQDMVVNPVSKKIYFAVHHEDGTPVLLTMAGDDFEWIPLDDVSYNKKAIEKAVDADANDRRGRSLRAWTVSDISYSDGNIMVSGLSNKEFASSFRSISFPFADARTDPYPESYQTAHGQYEAESLIKSFTAAMVNGKNHLMALPFVNVMQLDRLDSEKFVLLKREMNGELNLVTQSNRWLQEPAY